MEALRGGRRVDAVRFFAHPESDPRLQQIADEAHRLNVRTSMNTHMKDAKGKNRMESTVEAEMEDFRYTDIEDITAAALKAGNYAQIIALDHIQDPRNLGAILRSAAAAGAQGAIIQAKRCCPVTAVAYETSSGGAEHIPVAMVTNLATTLRQLKDDGFWAVGADERAEKTVYESDLRMPLVWVLGTEGRGLHRLVRECCDFLVKVPTRRASRV